MPQDVFSLQDEITMKVLTAMRVKWAYGEHERAIAKGTQSLEAYLKVMQAWEYCQIVNKESQAAARQLAEEAIALDRGYAQAYRLLAQAMAYEVALGTYEHREEALRRAVEMAQKAVSLDDTLAVAHATLGYVALMLNRDYDKAIAEAERAVALEPNSAEAYHSLGSYLIWSGQFKDGIEYILKTRVQNKLLSELDPTMDITRTEEVRRTIQDLFEQILAEENIVLSRPERARLFEQIAAEILGFGPLQPLLEDDTITEIMVNGPKNVYIERKGKLHRVPVTFENNDHVCG